MKNRLRVTQSKSYSRKSTFSKSCIDVKVKKNQLPRASQAKSEIYCLFTKIVCSFLY